MVATPIRQQAFTQASLASVMTNTDLASLATGSYALSAAAFNNSVNLDIEGDFFLTLGTFGAAPTATMTFTCYILESSDGGTTFPGYDATNHWVQPELQSFFFSVEAQTVLPTLVARNVPLPPGYFKVLVLNSVGQSTPSTGNSMGVLTHSMQAG